MLEYYLLEDRSGKCRGSNHMGEATVIPSPDDENTFTINFVSGDHYKVSSRVENPSTHFFCVEFMKNIELFLLK